MSQGSSNNVPVPRSWFQFFSENSASVEEGLRFSVWPAIPVQYEMVPEYLEDAVKEVKYIADELTKLLPTPLPEDDLQCYSDLLRSLETRTDLTQRIFLEVDVRRTISAIAQDIYMEDDTTTYGIKERALALMKYWNQHMRDSSIENPPFEDRPVPPFKSDGGDDDAWTLRLTEEQASRAEREYLDRKRWK
ncbi:hypothetical protein VTN00DRAFT_2369 [Thermoascus crustaceus]|uniref:uncharacterized protein n=1 Tax=Thermoascus crustaceus TaxID=5088 RepID=UPI0037448615